MKEEVTHREPSKHRNSLQPGYKLYWYRIDKILGQGGFAITYLAEDLNLNLKVAIKEYFPTEFSVRDTADYSVHPVSEKYREKYQWGLERFISEARTLTNFNHPNIVRVMSVFEEKNTAYMVMAYEEGDSLKGVLDKEGTLTEEQSKGIVLSILDGLEHVHNAGFIHRDIKPANIFIRADNTPVLIDFGSARHALGSRTRTLTGFASPGYAPFEQYNSKSDKQGPWTDIYGLGATLYRGVAGMLPMDAISRSQGILKGSNDMLLPVSELCKGKYSEAFLNAIDHALQFHEHDRPQSVRQWMRELQGEVQADEWVDSTEWVRVTNGQGEKESLPQIKNEQRNNKRGREPGQQAPGHMSWTSIFVSLCVIALGIAGWTYRDQVITELSEFGLIKIEAEAPPVELVEENEPDEIEAPVPEPELEPDTAEPEVLVSEEIEQVHTTESADEAEPEDILVSDVATEIDVDVNAGEATVGEVSSADSSEIATDESSLAGEATTEEIAPEVVTEEDVALTEVPEQVATTTVVADESAEIEEEISRVLAEAQSDLDASRLISPIGNNALYRYQRVLELDSENLQARAGIQAIVSKYVEMAEGAIENNQFKDVELFLAEAERINPEAESIEITRRQLAVKRGQLAGNAKFAQLVARAKSALQAGRVNSPPGENAIELFRQASKIRPGSGVVRKGYIDIGNVLMKLADDASYSGNYSQAYAYLDQAKALLPNRVEIDTARNYVTERKQRREQADARERELERAKEQ